MKSVRFHPDAEVELTAEACFYEERAVALGERFIQEVQAAVQLAAAFPGIGSPYRYGTRRVFPKSFPFSIIYRELAADIVVLAIAPFPRKPGYWRQRKTGG
ncbi:type II toxin-antitoxin system RelE/ParE family toxin [Variovorax sp. DT-64]|uniref:type II toxin-antitoxin system RelE/ParE family toxin n=1 Tax=Variovorax sp. DT-64 TaxID=3396160 RepID=UPI003F1DB9ED